MIKWIVENLLPITVVWEDELGVLLRRGKFVRQLSPGCYWTVPIIDEVRTIQVIPQILDLPDQTITIDGAPYSVSGSITYHIDNAYRALLCVQNEERALSCLAREVILEHEADMDKVYEALDNEVDDWGIVVTKAKLNKKVPCLVLVVTQDNVIESET